MGQRTRSSRSKPGFSFLVLELDPEHLSVVELGRRMSADNPRGREAEMATIGRAVKRLKEVGLLSERNGRIIPTPAALRFNALYI